jgi:hypothetical protein
LITTELLDCSIISAKPRIETLSQVILDIFASCGRITANPEVIPKRLQSQLIGKFPSRGQPSPSNLPKIPFRGTPWKICLSARVSREDHSSAAALKSEKIIDRNLGECIVVAK